MKKFISCLLALVLALSVTACGGSTETPPEKEPEVHTQAPENQEQETESKGIEVDEGLLDVDITLPASIFSEEDMTAFDPDAYAAEQGFKKAVLNDDGSVTVTMSKKGHKKLMEEMHEEYAAQFDSMVGAEDTPYITDIEYNDDFSKVTYYVSKAEYENAFDFSPFFIGFAGMMYQAFDGSELHVDVITEDDATGEVLNSVVYPDAFDSIE